VIGVLFNDISAARISNKQSKLSELSSTSKARPAKKRTVNDGLCTSAVSPAVNSGSEAPSTKRRRITRASMATATTSEYTSPPSFEFSRDGTIDTPTTSVGDVEMNDVGTELENLPKSRNGKKTVIPPSDDDSYLSNEDEEAEKCFKPRRNKGKGKAVANPYSESEDESQLELEEGSRSVSINIPDSQDESEFEIEERSDSSALTELSDEDTIAAPPTASSVTVNPPHRVSTRRRRSRWMHLTRVCTRCPVCRVFVLTFYLQAERDRRNLYSVHPSLETAWDNLDTRPRIDVKEDEQPAGLSLSLLPFQKEGLYWLRHQEQSDFGGGILADEMGMGKTIQTLSLIMSDPNAKPNLVVAPTVAIMQWKAEIEKYTGSALSVYIFHGAGKTAHHKELAKYNVVLTTYNLLESVFRKQESGFKRKAGLVKEASVLHKIDYHRVILDEAHNIKDRSCNTAKAVFALNTKYKLCLSGTPLQNRIGELFSLLRFLELDPFAYYFCRKCPCKQLHWKFSNYRSCDDCGHPPMSHLCLFNYDCLKPIQNNGNEGEGKVAFGRIHKLMSHIMLRRTKKEREEDLGLPPKVVRIRRDKFSEEELDLYDSIYNEGKRKFDTYVAQGVVLVSCPNQIILDYVNYVRITMPISSHLLHE
jgi:SNF2 family DNA or RNA helicase